MQCLPEDADRVTPRNHDRRGKTHRVTQTLDRCNHAALEDDAGAHRFHPEHADTFCCEPWKHDLLEAVEVTVHHVERHLYRIEPETVATCFLECGFVNRGALVTGE